MVDKNIKQSIMSVNKIHIKEVGFMLTLKNIKKDYLSAAQVTHALKGINLSFRKNEFVSILGPSGCGKTTLLNIIGGLDRYTSGDLKIKHKSTKNYNDRDWDTYRNHSIGFVFQSYNLISHLNILGNVELALTIGGISKKERTNRALKALEAVGLGDVSKKKPNQLSGGQMQRVAIARALVNDPEILLADEPTGALDSGTSIQIMELLKEVAKDRLVIMVTHNPELAKAYSNRIVTMKDGLVIDDTNPYDDKDEKYEVKEISKKKAKMSLGTAFALSSKNLVSKIKRTSLVVIAGSIGIIGVSAVLAVSYGVKSYIRSMQDDMLSGNPVTISETALDLSTMMKASSESMINSSLKESIEDGKINIQYMVEYLAKQQNNLSGYSLKNHINEDYLKFVEQMPNDYYSAIMKQYGINPKLNLYTNVDFTAPKGNIEQVSLHEVETMYTEIIKKTEFGKFSSMISMFTDVFYSMPNNPSYIENQYDILNEGGYIPTAQNEMMIVVSKKSALTDIFLGQLGYLTEDEFVDIVDKYTDPDNNKDLELSPVDFDYDTLVNKKFIYYPNNSVFKENTSPTPFRIPFTYIGEVNNGENLENGMEMKITAIVRAKENVSYGCLDTGIVVSPAFEQMILNNAKDSKVVTKLFEEEEYYNSLSSTDQENYKLTIPFTYTYAYRDEGLTSSVGSALSVVNLVGTTGGSGGMFSDLFSELFGDRTSVESQFKSAIRKVGGNNIPNSISVYPLSFDDKHFVTNYLDQWNDKNITITVGDKTLSPSEREDIKYTDNLELVINLINNMIDIISIALICFTSLSLVVSTVMIGIITYVSVIERIKEIGIIRSLGGRKLDVSNLFNVETFIIGLSSGLFGIAVTYGICLIVNAIINNFVKVGTLMILPWYLALLVIAVSIGLTLISGLIPAIAAAHKDPVVALRSND